MSRRFNLIDVSADVTKLAVDQMFGAEAKAGRVVCLCPILGYRSTAPTKRQKNYHLKLDVLINPDVIEGENAITEFGGFVILALPKDRIKPAKTGDEGGNGDGAA